MLSRAQWFRHKLVQLVREDNQYDNADVPVPADEPQHDVENITAALFEPSENVPDPAASADFQAPDTWHDPVYHRDDPENDITLGETMLLYFELLSSRNVSDATAKAVYTFINTILPDGSNSGTWSQAKALLEDTHRQRVTAVDLCPNDCIAYIDAQHPKLKHYQHHHRSWCPVCGFDRYLLVDGQQVAAKVGYYLKIGPWLRDMFQSDELAKDRTQSSGTPQPPGHVSHSRGWQEKLSENPNMADEPRHQGLVGMSDGIPLFKDKNAMGVTPIALRTANLPDSLSNKFRNIHLAALYPHHFWSDKDARKQQCPVRKKKRKPTTLTPMMYCLVDDLLFWEDGQMVTDTSRPVTDPDRDFNLKCILLYWCGDYPGLGEATGFCHGVHHKMCHWCETSGIYSKGLSRSIFGDYIRYTHVVMCACVCGVCVCVCVCV
jgi:hypothetical protein